LPYRIILDRQGTTSVFSNAGLSYAVILPSERL
jgi:hypothetical protein